MFVFVETPQDIGFHNLGQIFRELRSSALKEFRFYCSFPFLKPPYGCTIVPQNYSDTYHLQIFSSPAYTIYIVMHFYKDKKILHSLSCTLCIA